MKTYEIYFHDLKPALQTKLALEHGYDSAEEYIAETNGRVAPIAEFPMFDKGEEADERTELAGDQPEENGAAIFETKNGKKVARFTPEEDKVWTKAFEFYVEQGKTDDEADVLAWKDTCEEFPRLKEVNIAI